MPADRLCSTAGFLSKLTAAPLRNSYWRTENIKNYKWWLYVDKYKRDIYPYFSGTDPLHPCTRRSVGMKSLSGERKKRCVWLNTRWNSECMNTGDYPRHVLVHTCTNISSNPKAHTAANLNQYNTGMHQNTKIVADTVNYKILGQKLNTKTERVFPQFFIYCTIFFNHRIN